MAKSKKTGESKHRPEAVLAYLESKGWSYELDDSGNNYKVRECVFCGNSKGNFEIQKDRGYYKTWCCGESGSFYELRKSQNDLKIDVDSMTPQGRVQSDRKKDQIKEVDFDQMTTAAELYHSKIFVRAEALQYIKSRGFNEESLARFKIGCMKQNGKLWLTIPHFEKGKAVNIKYRTIAGDKKWRQEEGSKKVLFNADCIANHEEVILVEGELKAVALMQVGFDNVISLTGGVQNFKPEWVDQLDGLKKIYMCLDSDDAGQKGAEELSMRLGPERCYNIVLEDAKDPDEWLFDRRHTADEFRQLMRKAKQFGIRNVVSLSDSLGELYYDIVTGDADKVQGLMTPWEAVNKITKGFRPGELIILSAPPKIGKTTWALDVTLHQAKLRNPVGFFCLEMSAKRLAQKVIQNMTATGEEDIDADIVSTTRYEMRKLPIYLMKNLQRGIAPEDIYEAIKNAYRRFGLKLIVFDNLHFLVRGTDKLREQIGEVSQQFKLLAEELRVPIILIVHPRKLNKNRAMTADDFKESASIHADADQIIMLHRKRKVTEEMRDFNEMDDDDEKQNSILSPETEVIIDASRFTEGGKVTLWYKGEISKFVTMEEHRQEL